MSAPSSNAPLAVNTRDGMCWTRRTVTSSGIALYAPEGVCSCPAFVMATLPELAELGISGSVDALPVPVAPEPQASDTAAEQLDFLHRVTLPELRRQVQHHQDGKARWRKRAETAEARVAGLEAERHSTNESLSEAAEHLRADRDRIAELEKRETAVAEFVAARAEYITAIRNCHPDNGHDYDRWQGHAAARRQLAELLELPVAWPADAPASEHGAEASR